MLSLVVNIVPETSDTEEMMFTIKSITFLT